MFDKEILCPKCGGEIDATLVMPWSDPSMAADVPAEPYVCGWCASLLIVFTKGPEFHEPDEETIAAMRSNQALWQAITTEQAKILALPNRRRRERA
jgi:hypothetical protein